MESERVTAGSSSRRKGRAGFAAQGARFYTWDDDEGALVCWARELATVERGSLARLPPPPAGRRRHVMLGGHVDLEVEGSSLPNERGKEQRRR
jgi:hypothetical protein